MTIKVYGRNQGIPMGKQAPGSGGSGGGGGGITEIPVATSTTLGGVKIGSNMTVEADGTLSATGKLDLDSIDGGNSQTVYALVALANASGNTIAQYNGATEGGIYSDIT